MVVLHHNGHRNHYRWIDNGLTMAVTLGYFPTKLQMKCALYGASKNIYNQ